jgi:hypothetical protein
MMEAFILILWVRSGPAGGLTTVEFRTQEACEAALEEATARIQGLTTGAHGVCVEKG